MVKVKLAKDTLAIASAARLPAGAFQFSFPFTPGATCTALAATNPALPLTNWNELGGATELSPGQFQFTDPEAANRSQRFYGVRVTP